MPNKTAFKGIGNLCLACDPTGRYVSCGNPSDSRCVAALKAPLEGEGENADADADVFESTRQKSAQTGVNPKDLIGSKKVPLSLVPYSFVAGTAVALQEGGVKYGPFNYRDIPVQSHIYIEALLGHAMSFSDGEDIDPDSGLHHLYKASACIAILIDGLVSNRIIDTRHTKGKIGAGTFSRDISKILGNPEVIKQLFEKPYAKTIGLGLEPRTEPESKTEIGTEIGPTDDRENIQHMRGQNTLEETSGGSGSRETEESATFVAMQEFVPYTLPLTYRIQGSGLGTGQGQIKLTSIPKEGSIRFHIWIMPRHEIYGYVNYQDGDPVSVDIPGYITEQMVEILQKQVWPVTSR